MAIAKDQPEIIFRSKLPDIEIPTDRFPLHAYCFENLPKFSNRPCLINATSGHVYTYSDVDVNAKKVASGLYHHLGIRKGDVIMLLLHNSPEFMFAFLGASLIGAITTTANPLYLPDDIANQVRASNSKLIITESKYVEKLNNFGDEVKIICIDSAPEKCLPFSELLQSDENNLPEVKIDQNDTVGLLYSSGTTGLPKAVVLTHKGLITSIAQHVDGENPNLYFSNEDVIMCVLPLLHLYSLCSVMLSGLRAGSAMVIVQRFEIGAFLEVVDKYKVSILPSVPPILAAIADSAVTEKHDLSPVRMVISAATPLGRKLEDAVKAKLPNAIIGQVYGMTEASVLTICMSLAKEPGVSKLGSCGSVVRNAEVKIMDPITKASLPRNQRGEICVRSNQLAKGYLNNPKATEETIDKEGWLHTGDIGYIDDDDELFVVDRIKELIKYKGFQVAPAELETMLIAHPNISDAAVVSMKDEIAGEIPVAFVVRANGTIILEEDIKKYIAKQVIFYKRIHRVFFVDTIPKATSGKILRKELRQKLVATSLS